LTLDFDISNFVSSTYYPYAKIYFDEEDFKIEINDKHSSDTLFELTTSHFDSTIIYEE